MLVQYKGKNLYSFADKFRLLPGLNEVDDLAVNDALNHPIFKRRVANGSIVIVQSKMGSDGRMSVTEMKRLIPNVFDKKLLEKMLVDDDRPEIHKAVIAQIEKIKHPAAGNKKTESDVEYFGGSTKGE